MVEQRRLVRRAATEADVEIWPDEVQAVVSCAERVVHACARIGDAERGGRGAG
jgi:hypothetical protein